jgi:flagellar basal-body rod protein FlgB
MRLFDGAIEHLTRGLAFATRRHEILARNLANAETPGYRALDLVFDDHLRPLLGVAPVEQPVDLAPVGQTGGRPRIVLSEDRTPNAEGNDVKLDRQTARLAENTLYHQALVQILASRFNTLRQAVSGRV